MKTKNKILYSIVALIGVAVMTIPTLLNPFSADATLSTIDKDKKGSITLHKYEQTGEIDGTLNHDGTEVNIPDGSKPLKDVEFSIWSLGNNLGTEDYIETVEEAEAYITGNGISPIVQTTGSDGIAKFSNLTLGQYLVKETKSPENVSMITPPFIINVPTTITVNNVDSWLYDIHVYPKNQTIYGSVILNKVDENENGLQGATFDLYATDDDPTTDDVLRTKDITTNEKGQLVVENLPKGKYYFVETKAPEGFNLDATPIPFEIVASGTVKLDDVSGLYVKTDELQQVVEKTFINNKEPNIHKGVKSVTNQYSGYDFDEGHEWVISPDVPADIDKYTKYIVTDTIDSNLIFSGLDKVKVFVNGVWTEDSNGVAGTYSGGSQLTLGTDYNVVYDEATRQLKVTFIDGTFVGGQTSLSEKDGLYIFFETTFDESKVSLGKDYPNQAKLTFNNRFTGDKEKESEIPKVHTGGLSLFKYTLKDGSAMPLLGAEFRLAASEEDAKQGIFIKKDSTDIIGTSDADGIVKFEGIAYGLDGVPAETGFTEYWLVETKAPEIDGVKYNLLDAPKKVVINATSHIVPENIKDPSGWTVSIINNTGIKLPITGGIGTLLFYVIGLIIMGSAMIMMVKSSRKNKKIS